MTIINAPSSSTIYFDSATTYYIDSSGPNSVSWPVTINNTTPSSGYLKVIFRNDIIFTTSINQHFICGSEYIQFGDTSLRPNGERAKITVSGISNYPGLIKNGDTDVSGNNNIRVFNISVLSINGSTLAEESGWVGQRWFGNRATNNVFINCFSDGTILDNGGGIVGLSASRNSNGLNTFRVLGCGSIGNIDQTDFGSGSGGGITGPYCCYSDNTSELLPAGYIQDCYTTGQINNNAGGIVGATSGIGAINAVSLDISNCYTTGVIIPNSNGGGIVGATALGIIVNNSYTRGTISNGGGIFGGNAGNAQEFSSTATNCYTTGDICGSNIPSIGGGGIYGANWFVIGGANHCYTSGASDPDVSGGGIYSGSNEDNLIGANNYSAANAQITSGWSNFSANDGILTGIPIPAYVGSVWANDPASAPSYNAPYIFSSFGYTPYAVNNIDMTDPNLPNLQKIYRQTIAPGETSNPAILTDGHTFYILGINDFNKDDFPTISINPSNGAITAAVGTLPDLYDIVVYDRFFIPNSQNENYTTTRFILTVAEPTPPEPTGGCCVTSATYKGLSADEIADYRVGNLLLTERRAKPNTRFSSYEEYMKYKKAVAGVKR